MWQGVAWLGVAGQGWAGKANASSLRVGVKAHAPPYP